MKKRLKDMTSKLLKVFLVLFMSFTCINLSGFQSIKAVEYLPEARVSVNVLAEGINIPHLGSTANLYEIEIGDADAFCLAHGKSMRSSYYVAETSNQVSGQIKQVLNWYKNTSKTDEMKAVAQATIWAIQAGVNDNLSKLGDIYEKALDYYSPGVEYNIDDIIDMYYTNTSGMWSNSILNQPTFGDYPIWMDGSSSQQPVVPVGTPDTTIPVPKYGEVTAKKSYAMTDQIVLNINKIDVDTGNGLADVEFELYRDNTKIASVKTNAQGRASYIFEKRYSKEGSATEEYISNADDFHTKLNKDKLPSNMFYSKAAALTSAEKKALAKAKAEVQKLLDEKHTYKAVETKTKTAYYLDSDNNTWNKDYVSGDGSGSVSFSVTNKRQLGTINITKLDAETNNLVDQAIYGLYAKNPIIHPDGHIGILYTKDELVATFPATATNGKATLNNLYLGDYYVKEITAPDGYVLNTKKYDLTLSYAGQEVSITDESITVDDKVQRASLSFIKKDRELENGKDENIFDGNHDGAQGDATRQNATYGLYARESITHPDGTTGVVQYNQQAGSINEIKLSKGIDLQVKNVKANAGTLLATAKTNKNGEIQFDHLYNGKYYVKEIEPSEGYLLDSTEYNFDLTYTNQDEAIIKKDGIVLEIVKKQAFEVLKVGHVSGSSGVVPPLRGVEFTVKLESDVQRMGWDQAPIYDILITDLNGKARSIELPYGTYRVRETKPALDYATADDFFVTITEDSRKPQEFTNNIIVDEMFSALVKAVKLDEETGKIIHLPDTTFKIKALTDVTVDGKKFKAGEYIGYWNWNIFDGFYTDTWTTNEDGYVIINEKLSAGEYQLEEIYAPHGYILDETPVQFKVTNANMYETLADGTTPVITVHKSDVSVKGQITVEKRGEVLVGFENGNFVYEERGLTNAEYKIRAGEDIIDPSNDGNILYQKGEIVETIITGTNGKATSQKLPLGTYEVYESKAPHGMVLNKEVKTVILEYNDENIPVVFENIDFVNERQKVNLSLLKKDTEEKVLLKDGEFDFIANEDITNVDGDVIVEKGTVLSHVITNEDGKATVDLDLPLDNSFVFIEIKAPYGYILDETPVEVTTTYAGQDIQVLELTKTKTDKETEVEISKTDMTTSEELEGNTLTIFEKENESHILKTWVSDKESKVIKNLETEKRYVLRETETTKGFYLANDIEFELDKYGNLFIVNKEGNLVEAEENKIVMENDLVKGRLEWNKTGEIFNQTLVGQTEFGMTESPVWEKSNLLQSEITIYAGEDIILGNGITYYKKNQKIQTIESDLESVQSQDLLVGKYYYVETKTPHGYITDTDKHYFEIKDNQSSELQIVKEELYNKRPTVKIEFTKVLENPKHNNLAEAYKEVVFGIYAREDIYDYKGNVGIENGTMIATSGIDENGHLTNMPDLPNGVYYLKELQTNPNYVLDTNEYDFEIGYHGADVSSYKVIIGEGRIDNKLVRGNIEILKKDSFDNTIILKDIEFNISADESMTNVIAKAKTDETGVARFENMAIGTYYIQEAKQVDGYAVNDHIYKVEITTNGEVIAVEIDNKPTEMEFSKVDTTGNRELVGAKIQILDRKTDEIIDEWISGNESHYIFYLVEGKEYIMREIYAPDHYILADDIVFVAMDGKKVVMENKRIATEILRTYDNSISGIFIGLMMMSGIGIFFTKRKRKQKVLRLENKS